MSNLLEIMDKKSCGKSEIYISEEDGVGTLATVLLIC